MPVIPLYVSPVFEPMLRTTTSLGEVVTRSKYQIWLRSKVLFSATVLVLFDPKRCMKKGKEFDLSPKPPVK